MHASFFLRWDPKKGKVGSPDYSQVVLTKMAEMEAAE